MRKFMMFMLLLSVFVSLASDVMMTIRCRLFQFQIKDEIKAARIEATKAYNYVR